jgi:hypothetical protein
VASRKKRGGGDGKWILNLFFCSFKSWIALFFCSKDSCADRMWAVWSCKVRACFLKRSIIVFSRSIDVFGAYLSSAVFAR